MISLAAAMIIQKAADSRIAIFNYLNDYFYCNYRTTLTTVVSINHIRKYAALLLSIPF